MKHFWEFLLAWMAPNNSWGDKSKVFQTVMCLFTWYNDFNMPIRLNVLPLRISLQILFPECWNQIEYGYTLYFVALWIIKWDWNVLWVLLIIHSYLYSSSFYLMILCFCFELVQLFSYWSWPSTLFGSQELLYYTNYNWCERYFN